jgi:hypothetical protein
MRPIVRSIVSVAKGVLSARLVRSAMVGALAGILLVPRLAAQSTGALRLETLEGVVEVLGQTRAMAIDRPPEVASFVFGALKHRVKVYPTENYYYFRFLHDGVTYTGNFRLDPRDRDSGNIHFSYTEELADWKADGPVRYVVLSADSGFQVERVDALTYRVTHRSKPVIFALNDLSAAVPPPELADDDEEYIGPIFDESALRFFLFYNRPAKAFLYVLDETVPPIERFDALKEAPRILIGRRTGFAFYGDHRRPRKILIGVFASNGRLNTYLDGPFDQLPENFIKGDTLRRAIVDGDPTVAGKIGPLGHYDSGARYAIHPYMHYEKLTDLRPVERCASARARRPSYYRCFVNPPR